MITRGSPGDVRGSSVELRQDDARLTLAILSPQDAAWQVIDTATPRNPWDSPNRGTQMLAFEVAAPTSGELTLAVLATPGSVGDSAGRKLELRPLSQWQRGASRP